MLQKVDFFGIEITRTNPKELIDYIVKNKSNNLLINYLNVYGFNLAHKNDCFRKVIGESDILFCDGFGIKLAISMKGEKIVTRMTPPDWIDDLFIEGTKNNMKFFFLGDEEYVINKFSRDVLSKHYNINIVGCHHGFFQKRKEEEKVFELIKSSNPDIILVGMGMPRQEIWSYERRPDLPGVIFISVGALFRWYSGIDKRAPSWITNNGLEWLARLLYQPKKVWKRYIIGIPLFFILIIRKSILSTKSLM